MLWRAGIDPALSQHVAHLFVRDTLFVFDRSVEKVDDGTMTDHFESIQSTNWYASPNSNNKYWLDLSSDLFCIALLPPQVDGLMEPPRFAQTPTTPTSARAQSSAQWRYSSSTSKNSAFYVFVVLLTSVIIAFDLNLYVLWTQIYSVHTCAAPPARRGASGTGWRTPASSCGGGVAKENDDGPENRGRASFAAGVEEEKSYKEMTLA